MYIILVLVLENTVRPQTSRIHPLGPTEIQTLVDREIHQAFKRCCRVQEVEKIRSGQNWAPNWCVFFKWIYWKWMVGGFKHEFYNFLFSMIFHDIWDNHPNWLSYFSEGLKPPTRWCFAQGENSNHVFSQTWPCDHDLGRAKSLQEPNLPGWAGTEAAWSLVNFLR